MNQHIICSIGLITGYNQSFGQNIRTWLVVAFAIATVNAFPQNQNVDTLTYCVQHDGVGVGGYDPVSYFQADEPMLGKSEISVFHDEVKYHFSSRANKEKFLSDPVRYLPQFGGWCSMTLAMGRATTPTYDNFAILFDKLYLFERTLAVNGRELWLRNPKGNEKTAANNYRAYRTTGKIQ